jgi:DNA-binding winged helix-turn-helix (wHTH) protein
MPKETREINQPNAILRPGGVVACFGEFRLVPATRTLMKDGSPVHLGARALDILIALIERAGQVISSADLVAAVWPNTSIEESGLRVHIAALRNALGDGQSGRRFIISIRGRGYMFAAEVERISGGGSVASPSGSVIPNGRDHVRTPDASHAETTPSASWSTISTTTAASRTATRPSCAAAPSCVRRRSTRCSNLE